MPGPLFLPPMSRKKSKSKAKGGRPSKLTPEMEAAIIEDMTGGLGQDESASRNGIDRGTLREWIKRNPSFATAIEKAKSQFEQDNLTIIRQAAVTLTSRDGNTMLRRGTWQAAAWLLERRMHDKYGLRWQGEMTGKGGQPLIPESPRVDTSKFTKAQLDKLIEATSLVTQLAIEPPKSAHANGNGNGAT
jgi:hypothetical protein